MRAATRRWLKRLILLIASGCIIFAGFFYYRINLPVQPSRLPFEFTLNQGAGLRTVALQLREAGILQDAWSFVLLGRLLGKAARIKAGSYELTEPLSPRQVLSRITEGEITQNAITFIEGWTFRELRAALDAHPRLKHETAALADPEILARLGISQPAPEGLFFPETYFFATGASDLSVLKRAHDMMEARLAMAWASRAPDLPVGSPYEALILASIIEKETGIASDRAMIGGVFVNRLRLGMKLQTDPTVIYGMGEKFDGNLRKPNLLADGPYNTYTRKGLPPTPIAMPGQASLLAAVRPARTSALYFVARGDGSSHFSDNLADHNRAVERYQKNGKRPDR